MAQSTSSASKPSSGMPPMPNLPNVTADSWAALIKARPENISKKDWNTFVLTNFELGAGRAVPSIRIKAAIVTAQKAKVSDKILSNLKDAELNSLQLETIKSGREKLASQEPLTFGKTAVATAPATAKAPVAAARAKPTIPTSGEDVAYAKIVAAVKGGSGAKQYTYGKLNFAYEIARKRGDAETVSAIKKDMLTLRPLIQTPGRYGVSDSEYKNYEMVMKTTRSGSDAPAAAMAAAARTAEKIGHTEVALMLREKLPSAPAKAKAPVIAAKVPSKAPSKIPSAAKVAAVAAPAATAAAIATSVKKPPASEYRGVPMSVWKKLPRPPEGTSMEEWQTYAMVHYFLGTKNQMPETADLRIAAAIAAKVGKPQRAKIYTALMTGQTIPTMVAGRTAALATKPPSKYAAGVIGNSIIANAAHSNDPKVLKLAAAIAKEQGHSKTYTALLARIPKEAVPAAPMTAAMAAKQIEKTSRPAGMSAAEWTRFKNIIQAVGAKKSVPLGDIEWANALADRMRYTKTSVQLARAAADVRHQQAMAAQAPKGGPGAPPVKAGQPPVATQVATPASVQAPKTVFVRPRVATPSPSPVPVPRVATREPAPPLPTRPRAPDLRPPPPVTTPVMVPAETAAEIPVTPNRATVQASAKATGTAEADVAEKILEAKNNVGEARGQVAQGADFNRRLASPDPQTRDVARNDLKDLQEKKEAGDSQAKEKLIALAAAAAAMTTAAAAMTASSRAQHAASAPAAPTATEVRTAAETVVATKSVEKGRVEAPQASIAGRPSEGLGVGTIVAGIGLVGLGIVATLAGKKKKA